MRQAFAFPPLAVPAALSAAAFAATLLCGLLIAPPPLAAQQAGKLTPDRIVQSVVQIHADVPADAPSARRLGTSRAGAGAVIRADGVPDGHIVTIGYLITDASAVEVTDHAGRKRAAQVVGFDQASGLGLIRLSGKADLPALELGTSRGLDVRQPVIVAGGGSVDSLQPAIIASLRPYAASWEYMLERAIFAAPPIERFAGAPLLGADGTLIGIGSLLINDLLPGQALAGNMFVPAELLRPVIGEMVASGRPKANRPWLGLNADELQKDGVLVVGNISRDGPAAKAGLKRGDVVIGLAGKPIKGLADFYKRLWSMGEPGVEVPLRVMQADGVRNLRLQSGDRYKNMRAQPTY